MRIFPTLVNFHLNYPLPFKTVFSITIQMIHDDGELK